MKQSWALLLLILMAPAMAQTTALQLSYQPGQRWVQADYQLPRAVTEFRFEPEYRQQRQSRWQVPGPEWYFDGESLHRTDGKSFTAFSLQLAPDTRFIDRHYIAVETVGVDGWVLYLPALMAAGGTTAVNVKAPGGHVRRFNGVTAPLPAAQLALTQPQRDQLLYVGPPQYIEAGTVTIIAGPEIPGWLHDKVKQVTTDVVATLSARFAVTTPVTPTLLLTAAKRWNGSAYKGGTYADGMISFALRGIVLDQPDRQLLDTIVNTAAHESAHLFNGSIWQSAANSNQPWLHEGAAEYMAALLWRDKQDWPRQAEQHLNNCINRADVRPLNGAQGAVKNGAPYDCGYVLQLVADAAARRHGKDIFTLWNDIFHGAAKGRYTTRDFLAAGAAYGGATFRRLAQLLLDKPPQPGSPELQTLLAASGIEVVSRAADQRDGDLLRGRALQAVLEGVCLGRHGFTTLKESLVFDTGNRCGTELANDPVVVAAQNVNLFTDPAAAYEAIRSACGKNKPVLFTKADGTRLAPVRCTVRLAPLPAVYQVRSLGLP
ncbi:MAG TPA: hypothetical protein VMH83_13935 [Candidatus Acidoferrum sp.]|nr:hypothetical protein [Candidatus Acidoferrum sp.]